MSDTTHDGYDEVPEDEDSLSVEKPGNFEQIPHALWIADSDRKVSPGGVVAYCAISKRQFGRVVPKRKTLAKDMGVSVRTVDGRLGELVAQGWLLITPRFRSAAEGDQRQTSNHYSLLFSPLTGSDDPRLLQHQRRIAAFEQEMADRQATNARKRAQEAAEAEEALADGPSRARDTRQVRPLTPVQDSARGPVQDSARGPVQEVARGPVQDSAPQEKDSFQETLSTEKTTPPSPSLRSVGDEIDGQQGFILEGVNDDKRQDDEPAAPAPTFEDFWKVYPRKAGGKAAAEKTWAKAIRTTDPQVILDGARRFAADPNLPPKAEAGFIPHPSTWLNRGQWDDEPLPPRNGGRGPYIDLGDDGSDWTKAMG